MFLFLAFFDYKSGVQTDFCYISILKEQYFEVAVFRSSSILKEQYFEGAVFRRSSISKEQ